VAATKGSLEADIANAVTRFQREQQGRGATDIRAHLLGDLVVVRCGGIFTPTEARLAASEEARRLSKEAVRLLVAEHTEERTLSLLGEPRVNVLRLNLALDRSVAETVKRP
jgi:uncharacterized protein YbcI